MSGDVNPAHVDPEYAKTDMFHGVIAHGMWGGALISSVLGTELPGGCRCRRHHARRTRTHHPDQPGRQSGIATRLVCAGAAFYQSQGAADTMKKVVLVLNAGSSSLKFALYPDESGNVSPILRGRIAGMDKDPILSMSAVNGKPVPESALLRLNCAAGFD